MLALKTTRDVSPVMRTEKNYRGEQEKVLRIKESQVYSVAYVPIARDYYHIWMLTQFYNVYRS